MRLYCDPWFCTQFLQHSFEIVTERVFAPLVESFVHIGCFEALHRTQSRSEFTAWTYES